MPFPEHDYEMCYSIRQAVMLGTTGFRSEISRGLEWDSAGGGSCNASRSLQQVECCLGGVLQEIR